MKPPITINMVCSNQRKAESAADMLEPMGISVIHAPADLEEIQSPDLAVIARHKAMQAFQKLGPHVVVEDGGLFIEALNGFPGPYTAYVAKTVGAIGLSKLLDGIENRRALLRSVLVYVDDNGTLHEFRDDTNYLTIAKQPSECTSSDGWSDLWSVLIPPGHSRSYTDLNPETVASWLDERRRRSPFTHLGLFLNRQ